MMVMIRKSTVLLKKRAIRLLPKSKLVFLHPIANIHLPQFPLHLFHHPLLKIMKQNSTQRPKPSLINISYPSLILNLNYLPNPSYPPNFSPLAAIWLILHIKIISSQNKSRLAAVAPHLIPSIMLLSLKISSKPNSNSNLIRSLCTS